MLSGEFKTLSGKYTIFDITEFLPGRRIPGHYFPPNGICDGPWYFRPSEWKEPEWDGSTISYMLKFPMCYSPGFATAEEALAAAEQWEIDKPQQDAMAARALVDLFTVDL